MQAQTASLSEERLAELAKDPRNVVYKYEDTTDAPRRSLIPAAQLVTIAAAFYERFKQLRKVHPDWSDVHIRGVLRTSDNMFAKFIANYETISTKLANRETTQQIYENIRFMLIAKAQEEAGHVSADEAKAALDSHLIPQYRKASESKT